MPMQIKCSCGQLLDRDEMGISSHLRSAKKHPELRFNGGKGKVKENTLRKKRHSMLYVTPSKITGSATTQEERVRAKEAGIN